MLRRQIAQILSEDAIAGFKASSNELADQILSLFKQEIEKLGVISDEEIGDIRDKVETNIKRALTKAGITITIEDLEAMSRRIELVDIARAQLQDIKDKVRMME